MAKSYHSSTLPIAPARTLRLSSLVSDVAVTAGTLRPARQEGGEHGALGGAPHGALHARQRGQPLSTRFAGGPRARSALLKRTGERHRIAASQRRLPWRQQRSA